MSNVVTIKALTSIWTGDKNKRYTKLRETGIIGSLRWWYEAVIRGLGGTACDPTDSRCSKDNHCDACQLFGCTGLSRKFRLVVEERENNIIDLKFIELLPHKRKMDIIEQGLLDFTIEVISKYGALGGKIAERDYGLIKVLDSDFERRTLKKEQIEKYLKKKGSRVKNPNLERFIFINKNVSYSDITKLKKTHNSLKGTREKAKRYFIKAYKGGIHHFFLYAENDEEYKNIRDYFNIRNLQIIEGRSLLEALK